MSLRFKFNSMALATNPGLPAPVDRLATVKALNGLQGLYLFEDGTVGSNYTTAYDSSGNGNHATMRLPANGWVTATRSTAGILMPAGDSTHAGTCFDTPIPYSDKVGNTIIFGYKMEGTIDSTAGNGPTVNLGIVDNSLRMVGNAGNPGAASLQSTTAPTTLSPAIGKSLFYYNAAYDDICSIDYNGTTWYDVSLRSYPASLDLKTNNDLGKWAIIDSRLDVANAVINLSRNNVKLTTNQALRSGFVAPTTQQGFFSFGQFVERLYTYTKFMPVGELAFVIICNQPNTDAAVSAAITQIQTRITARGITIG